MKKVLLLAGLAAILTTGLMADKCTVNPPQAPATTEPEKTAPETPAAPPANPAQ